MLSVPKASSKTVTHDVTWEVWRMAANGEPLVHHTCARLPACRCPSWLGMSLTRCCPPLLHLPAVPLAAAVELPMQARQATQNVAVCRYQTIRRTSAWAPALGARSSAQNQSNDGLHNITTDTYAVYSACGHGAPPVQSSAPEPKPSWLHHLSATGRSLTAAAGLAGITAGPRAGLCASHGRHNWSTAPTKMATEA